MSSKRRIRRRQCEGKQRHESKADAQAHIQHLWHHGGHMTHAYKCKFCGGWHVGHHKKRRVA